GKLKNIAIMDTHGGRARAIESGDLPIDVAFLAMPAVDDQGNGTGSQGKNACGAIGYAIPDALYAKKVVLITDEIVTSIAHPEIAHECVDLVVTVSSIGDAAGIVSGTTRITKDPVGLKIARDAATILDRLGLLKDGFSMQTGAGGTSLAVVAAVREIMETRNLHARFASGGITSQYVEMLEQGRIDALMDVQCFDLEAVRSYRENERHRAISASLYGNPFHQPHPVVDDLDFVILGATEIDLDFNVNVTTDSLGRIIGGSGGHADTAHGAKVTIVTTNLIKARLPIIMEHVTTVTTPGEDIDILVTERGIAVNPRRIDLIEALAHSGLPILPIADLMAIAHAITGIPKRVRPDGRIVACVRYRDGSAIDVVHALPSR
ncbi:MAG: citrate lyase subunit alpha, partial [bacterium]